MGRVTVRVPTPLRSLTEGRAEVAFDGATTVGAVVQGLARQYPPLARHLVTSDGHLRGSVTVYLNDEDIRYLGKEATPVADGDVVAIVPAIAGGSTSEPSAGHGRPADAIADGGPAFSRDELRRYSRHLLLPEVGIAGQKKLRRSKVLLVGAGGLGAPAALYLAAAGVGEIGLVDFDAVDLSNLQRQVLYTTPDVGRPKLEAAKARLEALNPGVSVRVHPERLTSDNAIEVLRPYDIVLDGTDNFPTRYLLNDAAVLLGKPDVYGSIYRFEGQVSVFDARHGPCYRCLYPEPPPADLVPSCAEAGVLGVLPGLVGVLQATEAVKLLLGQGTSLVGRLLLFDALELSFRELKLRKNPHCVLCSAEATQKGLIDYPAFCGVPPAGAESGDASVPSVEPEALAKELRSDDPPLLIDVREPEEWAIAHLPEAVLIPRRELPERVDEVTRARALVLYCTSGSRSAHAARLLLDLGFTQVRNLKGGIHAWADRVDPDLPQY